MANLSIDPSSGIQLFTPPLEGVTGLLLPNGTIARCPCQLSNEVTLSLRGSAVTCHKCGNVLLIEGTFS